MSTLPLTEAEVQRQLADMAMFPEMNPGPVCRMDRTGTILLANTAAKKFFGSQNLVGKSWLDLCPGMDRAVWERVLTATEVFPIEAEIGNIWMHFAHVSNETHEIIFVYGTDISANKAAEKKLIEQARTISEIARFPDMNPGPVLRLDLDGCVLLSNAAATN